MGLDGPELPAKRHWLRIQADRDLMKGVAALEERDRTER